MTNDLKIQLINEHIFYIDKNEYEQKTQLKINVNKIFRMPHIMSTLCEYISAYIEQKNIDFNTIIPLSKAAIPFASDIAITNNKMMNLLGDSHIPIGLIEPDEKVLLFIDIINYEIIEKVCARLNKYGAQIVGIILLFNQDIGEIIRFNNIYNIITINDIADISLNKGFISYFEYEKYQFYSAYMNKLEFNKKKI